jgi:hypothetical protein
MVRSLLDRRVAWAVPAILAMIVGLILLRSEPRTPRPPRSPEAAPEAFDDGPDPPPNASTAPALPRAGGNAHRPQVPAPRSQPRVVAPDPEENRVIHGMTIEVRREKGFTPMRLYASRSGARLGFMATMLERDGRVELADSVRALGKEFSAAHQIKDEDQVGWGDLLSKQHDVMKEVVGALLEDDGGKENPFLRAIAAKTVDDIEDAMSGNLESVDRKIEEELDEQRDKDDPDEVKGGDRDDDEALDEGTEGPDGNEHAAGSRDEDADAEQSKGTESGADTATAPVAR